jgi:competence protein ComEC
VAGKTLSFLLWLAHSVAESPGSVALLPSMPRGAFGLMVAGGLWLCLWRTRWRLWGFAPAAAGALWALSTPVPDLLVTGDGKHLALRTGEGLALLRPRAGDYVRDMMHETSGLAPVPLDLESLSTAACSPDLCLADFTKEGRTVRLLATRSGRLVPAGELIRVCAGADIAVSERRLPRACQPRWLKADRSLLSRTGGLAIVLGERPRISTVSAQQGRHPWALAAAARPIENQRFRRIGSPQSQRR